MCLLAREVTVDFVANCIKHDLSGVQRHYVELTQMTKAFLSGNAAWLRHVIEGSVRSDDKHPLTDRARLSRCFQTGKWFGEAVRFSGSGQAKLLC